MSKKISPSCVFENDRVTFKSYIHEFTKELYDEFDSIAEKIGLQSKIDDLLTGKEVNYTEGLAAWHPKYRDDAMLNANQNGAYDPFDTGTDYQKALDLLAMYDKVVGKNIVTIGIGGSFEGPKMLLEALEASMDKDPLEIFGESNKYIFITGSDLSEFRTKTKGLNPEDTTFLISSKSFTTQETITILKEAISWSGDLDKFIAITANKAEPKKYNINNIIEFDKEIGGRYSIWSDISVLIKWTDSMAFGGFIEGGKQADQDLKNNKSYLKFIKYLAYSDIWLHNYKNKNSRAVLSYIWGWRSFPDYIQQLEMESLGKQPSNNSKFNKTGQIIFGGYGPTAQHSYFQLLHQGTQNLCADIVACKNDKKSLAYAQAITQSKLLSHGAKELKGKDKINGDIPINLFLTNITNWSQSKNTPKGPSVLNELGYLIATWEHRTYITAAMLGINPFDQFGVGAGKIYTRKYLAQKD